MTRDEAIKSMGNGEKLSHDTFTREEWVSKACGVYVFEDGCECTASQFWGCRHQEVWNNGWSIWKPE